MDKINECGCGSCSICYDFEMKPLLEAREAIQRVRDLHIQESEITTFCKECSFMYPCDTIKALDGEQ